MTVYNELNKIAYIGNTSQTLYPIPFEYINTEDIKVSIYTSKNEFVEDWRYSTQYVIEGGNVKVLSGYAIDKNKKLLILRRVDLVQDNKYREGGDFPAKSTETSFDKLTMITQQLQETLDRCVKVEVLDIQSPEQLLADVYSKLDSATEVAEQAIGAANQATTAAKDAKDAVVVAQQQITETQAFIEQARADINQTVEDSIEYVEQEAVKAATEVVGEVVGQYTDRAETAAKNAEADASRTAESANRASASATSAATSASEAEAIAGEVSVYNFKNKITNCITEIPQDIKWELANNVFRVEVGSKVYVPNGAGKFDEVVFTGSAGIDGSGSGTNKWIIVYNYVSKNLERSVVSNCASGSTQPTLNNYGFWYDTTNNVIKRYVNNAWSYDKRSLPICIVNCENNVITSIDQVFNGFGYIGSTVFALPNVKGLIPNGRNADGSLKNIEVVTKSVQTQTLTGPYVRSLRVFSTGEFSASNAVIEYNEEENNVYVAGGKFECLKIGECEWDASNKITSFQPKLPFRAVDQNDFNKLDGESVKTSGSQAISGQKTFKGLAILNASNNAKAFLKSQTIDITTAPTTNQTNQIYFGDKNEFVYGVLQCNQNTDKQVSLLLTARNATSSYHTLGVSVLPDGTGVATAPTPVSTATGTQVTTASWVRNYVKNTGGGANWASKVSVTRDTNYTAPSNGYIAAFMQFDDTSGTLTINSVQIFNAGGNVVSPSFTFVPVSKGDVINIGGGAWQLAYFVPFK